MVSFKIAGFNLIEFAKRFFDFFANPTEMDIEIPQKGWKYSYIYSSE